MAAISAATGAAGAASLAGLLFNNEDDEKTTIGGV